MISRSDIYKTRSTLYDYSYTISKAVFPMSATTVPLKGADYIFCYIDMPQELVGAYYINRRGGMNYTRYWPINSGLSFKDSICGLMQYFLFIDTNGLQQIYRLLSDHVRHYIEVNTTPNLLLQPRLFPSGNQLLLVGSLSEFEGI